MVSRVASKTHARDRRGFAFPLRRGAEWRRLPGLASIPEARRVIVKSRGASMLAFCAPESGFVSIHAPKDPPAREPHIVGNYECCSVVGHKRSGRAQSAPRSPSAQTTPRIELLRRRVEGRPAAARGCASFDLARDDATLESPGDDLDDRWQTGPGLEPLFDGRGERP